MRHLHLDSAIAEFKRRFGVVPVPGGRHVGWGTRNALVGLGEQMYLELVGLDPEQNVPVDKRFLSLDVQSEPRFAAWCARASRPLEEIVTIARSVGYDLGELSSMSRMRSDGSKISWTMTSPLGDREGGVLPFYIDWGMLASSRVLAPVKPIARVGHRNPSRCVSYSSHSRCTRRAQRSRG